MGYEDDSTDAKTPNARLGSEERLAWDRFETPSVAVIERVAASTGRLASSLPPLQDTVDADALDAIITSGSDDPATATRVSLTYENVEVTIGSDGRVTLESDTEERQ